MNPWSHVLDDRDGAAARVTEERVVWCRAEGYR
jgi:hypothetical protein